MTYRNFPNFENTMSSFPLGKYIIILALVAFSIEYTTSPKRVIHQETDLCVTGQPVEFSDFRPEYSVEEYEFTSEKDNLTFEVSFCTRSKMAIIAELQDFNAKRTISIQIVDGFLEVSVEEDANLDPECVCRFKYKQVNDGTLHKINIRNRAQLLNIELRHKYKLIGTKDSINYSHCVTKNTPSRIHHLVLGGKIIDRHGDSKIQLLYKFSGCMKNIRLNGREIKNVATIITSEDVILGCPEFDKSCTEICPPTAEYRNGSCVCPEGTEMDQNDTCSASCSCTECNEGTCYISSIGPQCQCPDEYVGSHCQVEVILDPCESVFCNNGSCVSDGDGNFKCICNPGFKVKSSPERDTCFINFCLNGTCYKNGGSDVTCWCPSRNVSNVCEEKNNTSQQKGSDTNKVILIVLGSIIGFIIIILLLVLCYCPTKYQRFLSCLKTAEQDNIATTGTATAENTLREENRQDSSISEIHTSNGTLREQCSNSHPVEESSESDANIHSTHLTLFDNNNKSEPNLEKREDNTVLEMNCLNRPVNGLSELYVIPSEEKASYREQDYCQNEITEHKKEKSDSDEKFNKKEPEMSDNDRISNNENIEESGCLHDVEESSQNEKREDETVRIKDVSESHQHNDEESEKSGEIFV